MRGVSTYSAMGAALSSKRTDVQEEAMREVGAILRETRESYNVSIEQVAADLHIASANLKGLESGDWSVIAGEVYARGYLRKYAEYLGFNSKDIFAKLHPAPKPNDPISTPVLKRRSAQINLKPAIVVLAMIALGSVIGAFLANIPSHTDSTHVKPLPEHLQHYVASSEKETIFWHHCLSYAAGNAYWACYLTARYGDGLRVAPYRKQSIVHLPEGGNAAW